MPPTRHRTQMKVGDAYIVDDTKDEVHVLKVIDVIDLRHYRIGSDYGSTVVCSSGVYSTPEDAIVALRRRFEDRVKFIRQMIVISENEQ